MYVCWNMYSDMVYICMGAGGGTVDGFNEKWLVCAAIHRFLGQLSFASQPWHVRACISVKTLGAASMPLSSRTCHVPPVHADSGMACPNLSLCKIVCGKHMHACMHAYIHAMHVNVFIQLCFWVDEGGAEGSDLGFCNCILANLNVCHTRGRV
jgi:hypothetical protein